MFNVKIAYYEGVLSREVEIRKAQRSTGVGFRPYGVRSSATLPIIPRPGDHVYFKLSAEDSKYFSSKVPAESTTGQAEIAGEVKFVELIDGDETIWVHVTDEGYGPYGRASGEELKELAKWVEDLKAGL